MLLGILVHTCAFLIYDYDSKFILLCNVLHYGMLLAFPLRLWKNCQDWIQMMSMHFLLCFGFF